MKNMPSKLNSLLVEHSGRDFTRKEIRDLLGVTWKETREIVRTKFISVGGGKYTVMKSTLSSSDYAPARAAAPVNAIKIQSIISSEDPYVPEKECAYVAWGYHTELKSIVQSRQFFPVFISGMSGGGKSLMVEQVCSELKREYIRVQISPESDSDSLMGGFRLVDGNTIFAKGPVVRAMERGAILLIDEIDRGSHKTMCLQGVLEGKPVLIQKTGETIVPAPGFNIIATANTNGRGDETAARYNAATIIDEAFIERFVIALEQPYANETVEARILKATFSALDIEDDDQFVACLVGWAAAIRKTYENDGIDDTISTRRLCHIVKTFGIFRDRMKAIELCTTRFEPEIREAFINLYTKIDATVRAAADREEL
jgi:hypothetical protein